MRRLSEEQVMEVHPIRTEEDYRTALKEIEQLWNAEADSLEQDKLDVLATLVEAYEARHHPVLPPDPIEAMRYFMESRGISRRDLETVIGPRNRVAEVLSRKRPLTLAMIRRLHSRFGLSAEVLIQPYSMAEDATRKGVTTQ